MKKVRCGIVGLGQIGPMHCESVSQIENAQLVCVCDLDEEKAKKYAQMYHCDYTLSFDELIARDDIDLIHVVPAQRHARRIWLQGRQGRQKRDRGKAHRRFPGGGGPADPDLPPVQRQAFPASPSTAS